MTPVCDFYWASLKAFNDAGFTVAMRSADLAYRAADGDFRPRSEDLRMVQEKFEVALDGFQAATKVLLGQNRFGWFGYSGALSGNSALVETAFALVGPGYKRARANARRFRLRVKDAKSNER
ncbi:MAG: hypothetical protein AAF850_00145 [Pseudomonadota bacterium]